MNSYGRGLAAVGGSGLGSSGAITARSVIAQFQQFLERSAAQDAQKAYELGHKEALVECAEILLEEGQGLETTEEYTQLPKKDLFSLGNAHRLVEESQTAPMQGPDFAENRFRVRDEEFVKYLDFLTQYTIIPHLQRQALQNYNSGRWYKVKAVEKEVDVDPTAEDDRLVISAWEKKVQRKFQQDTVHRVIPTEYKGPSVWWNIVGVSPAGLKRVLRQCPFQRVKSSSPM
uniref:Uncharacterized protein n=1 Tax=Rhodosorus marinus TaxID=101924 RepID=A0A7S2ZXU2_9RHOD|mmetsp:Transcript_34412/g.135344  ORF Transcript_34412/g.135344 Transcript_34412/m.135344 type:complete len:230 (+) Transcript_34412:339-1028(+)